MKNKVLLFTGTNTRILTVEDTTPWENRKDCLINPNLAAVLKTPPHFWKKVGDRVLPMCDEEKVERDKVITTVGVVNTPMPEIYFFRAYGWLAGWAAIVISVVALILSFSSLIHNNVPEKSVNHVVSTR